MRACGHPDRLARKRHKHVSEVNAESSPRARWRLVGVAPPVRWIHFAEVIVADVCIQIQHPPQGATLEQTTHLFHCGLEAAFMTDAHNATRRFARGDDAFGTRRCQGKWLLAEDMLAGGKRGDRHFFVKQVGGYDCNGIDIGAEKQCLVVGNKIEFFLRSERRGHRRVDIATCYDFEAGTICKTNRNLLAPPAQSYNPNSDHCALHRSGPHQIELDLIRYCCSRFASTIRSMSAISKCPPASRSGWFKSSRTAPRNRPTCCASARR